MDYTQLAADELIDRAYSARDEFNNLYESNDTSDSTLDRMASLVDELEALQTEADSRVAFAILNEKREELARKVKKKLILPGGLNQRTPAVLPAVPGSGPIAVGFAEGEPVDDDSKKNAGVDLADLKTTLQAKVEELAGKIPPAFLKNIEKVKAKAAAEKGSKGTKVEAQLDAPYKQDMTPARAKDVKVTPAISEENAETKKVEEDASPNLRPGAKPTLAIVKDNPRVAPIEHMPTKGFGDPLPKTDNLPTDTKGKHPGAKVIKAGTVKGLTVPKEQGQKTYSDEDPIAFEDSNK